MQIFLSMVARIAILTTLALAGCASAPPPPRYQPIAHEQFQHRFSSPLTPYAAAICIARNARGAAGTRVEERVYGESGGEVVVWDKEDRSAMAAARIERAGSTSSVRVWVGDRWPGDRPAFAQALMTGC